jgi:UDP:flavonoid glycosyltransferase YjiC (YdhE family)
MASLMGFDYSKIHVLVVSYPAQGHINPMLQFAKQLASKNLEVTFVTTEASRKLMLQAQDTVLGASKKREEVRFETISDGLLSDVERSDVELVLNMLCKIGGETLGNLIERLNSQGNQISCIVQDSFLTWIPEVAKKFNIPSAFFWTQSCAAFSIYHHFILGNLATAWDETQKSVEEIEIPGLPRLSLSDLPSFLLPSNPYGTLSRLAVEQFKSLPEATWILGNSFQELESEEMNSMKSIIPIRTVGPLIPSAFLDRRNPGDTDVGANLWKTANCTDWLDTKEPASVVYVSFGSLAVLSKEQTREIALGLKASGYPFIWVIRPSPSEEGINSYKNLPEGFINEISEQGLVVPWCQQLQVLSHESVGAFLTHCGWNSTLESLSLGVPMLAVPQWSDQITNSIYVEEQWKTGLRVNKRSADGLVEKEEVEKCIRIVMETERGVGMRKNASRWKTLASEATVEGGSSYKNIQEIIEEIATKALSISGSGVLI